MSEKLSVWDRTPQARYASDHKFRALVDMMEAYMHAAEYTPSEMREAALLAAIQFESRQVRFVHGHTMSNETAWRCKAHLEELFRAIQQDERPFFDEPRRR